MTESAAPPGPLLARRMGIDTHDEPVVYVHEDADVARSEGLQSHARVRVRSETAEIIANLNVVRGGLLEVRQVGLSEAAWLQLDARDNIPLRINHPDPVDSFSHVRGKIYGHRMGADALSAVVRDIAAGNYSNAEIAAFVTACANESLDTDEIIHLTRAMVDAGARLNWQRPGVADKHCVGGLPGNRTTPILVAIAACHGITLPKTSSRAITSPAGTADCMETLTRVDLSLEQMRRVVESEGACLAWGGSVSLSPADDVLIRVERSLDLDSEGQLIASVLSKKLAAGAHRVLIDVPVGPTAKVRCEAALERLQDIMLAVAEAVGLTLRIVASDGRQPVGRGIGPALEARDVLQVLDNDPHAPVLLREKSIALAGALLALCEVQGGGEDLARQTLLSGQARAKFDAICKAQGGLREPPVAAHSVVLCADGGGCLNGFDNRRLARLAKLAGAPSRPAAGITLHAKLGDRVEAGQPLLTLHAHSPGELAYALDYYQHQVGIICLGDADP